MASANWETTSVASQSAVNDECQNDKSKAAKLLELVDTIPIRRTTPPYFKAKPKAKTS
jgi:hypothetical protein